MKHKVLKNVLISCHSMLSCHKKHVLNNSGKTCCRCSDMHTSRRYESQVQVASASHRYKSQALITSPLPMHVQRKPKSCFAKPHTLLCFLLCAIELGFIHTTLLLLRDTQSHQRLASLKTTLPEWWPKFFLQSDINLYINTHTQKVDLILYSSATGKPFLMCGTSLREISPWLAAHEPMMDRHFWFSTSQYRM